MRYPDGACQECGERLYGTADGGTFCPNCGDHPEESEEGTASDERDAGDSVAQSSDESDGSTPVAESS